MGPEIIAAILGPIAGGAVSLYLWQNKKNYEFINSNFTNLNTSVNVIERKIDDIRVDVAKNYVTNEDLLLHIKGEEEWHTSIDRRMDSVSREVSNLKNSIDRIHFGEDPRG